MKILRLDTASCSLKVDQHIRGAYCLHYQGNEKATHEKSVEDIGTSRTRWNLGWIYRESGGDQAGKESEPMGVGHSQGQKGKKVSQTWRRKGRKRKQIFLGPPVGH
jgi:hypothetical protein